MVRTSLLLTLAAAALAVAWVLGARSLSLLLDRWQTLRLAGGPVDQIRYDNGVLALVGARLGLLTAETMPSGVSVTLGSDRRVTIGRAGQLFPCGPGHAVPAPGGLPDFTFQPDPGDTVTFTHEQSHLSWPTPLEMNFMTGSAPSWRRHLYCRLIWTKRSRARLEMLWRLRQGYFGAEGWRPQRIEFGSAGLVQTNITEPAELLAAASAYLTRTRKWAPADYRLESCGPAADGRGEIVAAIHRDDQRAASPGSGFSAELVVDYDSRQVTREIAAQ
ncbi:MAG TPA: hypothetical protein VGK29_05465 [Paludibaculum sp.]